MKLDEIKITPNGHNTHLVYDVKFDDAFTCRISHYVHRSWGHTLYREYEAEFCNGNGDLGKGYVFKNVKDIPRDNTNTVAGENLEMVLEHLEVIQDNPKVKGERISNEPFHKLAEAVSALIGFYQEVDRKYMNTLSKNKPVTEVVKF